MRTLTCRHDILKVITSHCKLVLLSIFVLFGLYSSPVAQAQVSVRLSNKSIIMGGEKYFIHKVKKGENLYSIAKAYSISEASIMKANSMTRSIVRKRQSLLIPQHSKRPKPQLEQIRPSIPPDPLSDDGDNFANPALNTDTTVVSAEMPLIGLRDFNRAVPLDIAVLLPLPLGRNNSNFTAFHNGILLGVSSMKKEGISSTVRFMNTGASEDADKVRELIERGELENANLIIGPVYANAFTPVAEYVASQQAGGVPIVSPLGMVGSEANPYVYEASVAESTSFDRIFEMFGGEVSSLSSAANIIVIDHVEYPDTATLSLIESRIGERISSLSFTNERSQIKTMETHLNTILDKDRDNIIYIPVNRVDALEGVLSHLSSINYQGKYRITVIGTPRWAWLSNINLELFFKLNVHYPTSYHANRSDPAVAEFYRQYIESFGSLPNLYSFRGYDVVRYFGGALHLFGTEMSTRIADGGYNPVLLQVGYEYRQSDMLDNGTGKYCNVSWPVVNYKPDFTIEVKQ